MSFVPDPTRRQEGFTIAEVVMALMVSGLLIIAIVTGFVNSANRAEWSGYSLAAQSLAFQGVEQARAAKWDPLGYPPVDNLTVGFLTNTINILDIPINGTNIIYATNVFTISVISANPPLRMVKVDCIWPFKNGRRNLIFSNTVSTFRAPDQ